MRESERMTKVRVHVQRDKARELERTTNTASGGRKRDRFVRGLCGRFVRALVSEFVRFVKVSEREKTFIKERI